MESPRAIVETSFARGGKNSNPSPHPQLPALTWECSRSARPLPADHVVGLPEGYLGYLGQVRSDRGDVERAGYLAGGQLTRPCLQKHGSQGVVGGDSSG